MRCPRHRRVHLARIHSLAIDFARNPDYGRSMRRLKSFALPAALIVFSLFAIGLFGWRNVSMWSRDSAWWKALRTHDAGAIRNLLDDLPLDRPVGSIRKGSVMLPLSQAVELDDADLIHEMIRRGAPINGRPHEQSPLLIAVNRGKPRAAGALLARGADPNHFEFRGHPPLSVAVGRRDLALTGLLLEHGANPNSPNGFGMTPLLMAVSRTPPSQLDREIMRLLIRHGARIGLLEAATLGDEAASRRLLASRAAGSARGTRSPLIAAIERRHRAIVRLLLDHGLDVNSRDELGHTPLMTAIGIRDLPLVRELIKRGADLEAQTQFGQTALIRAAMVGDASIVKELIVAGASIEDTNKSGLGAIETSVMTGDGATAVTLLDRAGWNSAIGRRALVRAAEKGRDYLVKRLLDRGIHPEAPDRAGRTALLLASEKGRFSTVRLLVERGADINAKDPNTKVTPLLNVLWHHNASLAKWLLSRGADAVAGDRTGVTPLMAAVASGDSELLRMLLDKGADPNARDKHGRTAADRIKNGPNRETISTLLRSNPKASTASSN